MRKNGLFLLLSLCIALLTATNAWAAGSAESGMIFGSIAGSIAGTLVMWRNHPLLGIVTAVGALSAIARMLSH